MYNRGAGPIQLCGPPEEMSAFHRLKRLWKAFFVFNRQDAKLDRAQKSRNGGGKT